MYAPPPPAPPPGEIKKKRKSRSWTLAFLGWIFASGMIILLAGGAVGAYFLWDISKTLPDYEKLAEYEPPVMTRIHANDGRLLAEYAHERRIYVPINAIPRQLINAFVATEDKNFFSHHGIDPKGIVRAAIANIVFHRREGASTITQQVAKNFLLTNERTLIRKAKEAILAIRIERAFTKDQIMELYLNEIFFGLRSYGVAAASLNYFGKSLKELEIHEMAYLAGLVKGPNNYHPFRHPKRAIARRNTVIKRMLRNHFITPEQAEKALKMPLGVNPRPFGARIFAAEYFAEEVRREISAKYGEKKLYEGGLSVRTTLDPKMQRWAKRALVDGLVAYDHRHGWRGPLAHVDNIAGQDWGMLLVKNAPRLYYDIAPWRQAIVLELGPKQAKIGLRPRRLKSGRYEEKRETGEIPLSQMRWARKLLKVKITKKGKRIEKKGRRPQKPADVLAVGDVIYVAPMRPRPKRGKRKALTVADVKGKWQLMQFPKIGGAIVVMDPHTGRVLAMVGGFSYDASNFNRATQAHRQPGSAFKPFVYATALDNGYTPATVINDAPIVIDQGPGQEPWRPKNYENKFYGPSTLRIGIEHSRNVMTVRLARDLGMPVISEYARRFGVYDHLMPVLSMSLGAGETTLLRLATGYCMIANGGHQVTASLIDRIQDRYGKTIYRHDTRKCPDCDAKEWDNQDEPELIDNRKQIIDPHTAYQITSMMEGVVKRGTGRIISRGLPNVPLAGKTGTTSNERDGWFMGFSPDLVVGVFMGYDNPTPMGRGETGGHVAAPVFLKFMKLAMKGKKPVPFRIPPGIRLVRINHKTGARTTADDPDGILEAFKPDTVIPENSAVNDWNGGSGRGLY